MIRQKSRPCARDGRLLLVTFVFVLHITTSLPPFLKSLGYLEITNPSREFFLFLKVLRPSKVPWLT